ncbi:uncharacterized protein LOC112572091 [Pomacea canaliculata]|uniref:uncharacterized protein LOC112572091 n=1 Tax=Pomacea canaliculata TaxID=400727 RepID=UPI000D72DF0B|nr:uncharacterized protein LOC112572091 [Pomacea canaliculata]
MPVLLTANWSVDVLQCPSLHYTHTFLACDVKSECWADKYDNSKTCSTPLSSRPPLFSCINEIQRVPYSLVCDHRSHCSDDSDEKFCIFPSCPRKTNVFECDNKQDETACDTYTCPGYYRCRSSHVCLHPDHVCDGWPQCPEGDDELLCGLSCPDTCVCHGLAFTCIKRFAASSYLQLRFLDASGSGMTPSDVVNNTMIVYLSFNNCNISVLEQMNLANLQILDLSDNYITSFSSKIIENLHNLRTLSLAVLNGFLFLLITAGQVFIFWSVRVNIMTDTSKKTKDLTIARRLMTVVVSDFCCKFPVALLGLLAARGTPVSSEVIVALVIFVVPLNSALNPFLYTYNVMKERRRKAREEKMRKYFMSLTK